MTRLDEEERDILEAFEEGKLQSVKNLDAELKIHQDYASITARKDKFNLSEFVKVARVEDVPPGGRIWHEFEYETVIILNVDGEFYCIADLCTHDDGPLEDGPVDGHSIECPRHGACFDIRTGAVLTLPATVAIPTYLVKVEDGDIYIENPDD